MKKRFYLILLAFVFSLFLFSCSKQNKVAVRRIHNFEVSENNYSVIKDITTPENKKDFSIDKYKSDIDKSLLKFYVLNDLKTKEDNYVINYYYDLKVFILKYEKEGENFVTETYKYLTSINLNNLGINKNASHLWVITTSNGITILEKDTFLIGENAEVSTILKSSDTEILLEASKLLGSLKYDEELKGKEAYYEGLWYVTKEDYNNLTNSYKLAFESYNNNQDPTKLSDLKILVNNINENKVIGERPITDFSSEDETGLNLSLLETTYNEYIGLITEKYESTSRALNDVIIIDNNDDLSNYYNNVKVITKSNYEILNNNILKLKEAALFSKPLPENLLSFKDEVLRLKEIYNKSNKEITTSIESITFGTKETNKLNYKVEFYYDNILNETKTITLQGNKNELVKYEPILEAGYKISESSILQTLLDSENKVLKVYYIPKEITLTFDFAGGTSEYDNNHIVLKYGSKINSEILNKIVNINKSNDNIGENYLFKGFLINNELVEKTALQDKVFDADTLLVASYTCDKFTVKPNVHIYHDQVFGRTSETAYLAKETELLQAPEFNTGSLATYTPVVPEGFEIDFDKSVLSFGILGKDDSFKVYLKRKLLKLNFNLDSLADFQDARVKNNYAIVKYDQPFDFVLEGIKKEGYIYKEILNSDGTVFDINSTIKENKTLSINLEKVTNPIVITYYPNPYGYKKDTTSLAKTLYLKNNSKIVSPGFFMTHATTDIALFDIENGIGAITNELGNDIDKNHTFTKKSELRFIYRLYPEMLDEIQKYHFPATDAKSVVREVKGVIKGKISNNLFVLEINEAKSRILVKVDDVTLPNYDKLEIGNDITLRGLFLFESNEFPAAGTYGAGRFYEYLLDTSKIILNSVNPEALNVKDVDKISEENNLEFININRIVITDTENNGELIPGYEVASDTPYISYRARDCYGNIVYLNMSKNNPDAELFTRLSEGVSLNLKAAPLLRVRALRNGIESFNNSRYKAYPTIIINDFKNQVTLNNSNDIVAASLKFIDETNNKVLGLKKYHAIKGIAVDGLISDYFDNVVFSGLEVKSFNINNEEYIYKENTKAIDDNTEITVKLGKAENYIEFYFGTYLIKSLTNISLKASYGGLVYEALPVDSDGDFYKFLLSYDKNDSYIKVKVTLNKDENLTSDFVIDLYGNDELNVRKFAAIDLGRYTPVTKEFGSFDKEFRKFSYDWQGQKPFEFSDAKGIFVHAFAKELNINHTNSETGSNLVINTKDEYTDGSLYSRILIKSEGLLSQDGDLNINKDWNMNLDSFGKYTNTDGHLFYKIDPNLTEQEINESNKFILKAYAKMNLNDIDSNGVMYETDNVGSYDFHKSSLTKYIKFNKFGLGVIHVDLAPYVTINGVNKIITYTKAMTSFLTPQEQEANALGKTDERIINTKEGFFNYLKNNLNENKNNLYTLLEKENTIELTLHSDLDVSFSGGVKDLTIKRNYDEELLKQDIQIYKEGNLVNSDFVFFINKTTNEVYQESNLNVYGNSKYDIIVVEPTLVKLYVTGYSDDAFSLYRISNGKLVKETVREKETYSRPGIRNDNVYIYDVLVPKTNIIKNKYLSTKFILSENNNLENYSNESFNIPFNYKDINDKVIAFKGSKEIVNITSDDALVVFVYEDTPEVNKDFYGIYLQTETNEGAKESHDTKARIMDKTIALVLENPNNYKTIRAFWESGAQISNVNFKTGYCEANKVSFALLVPSVGVRKHIEAFNNDRVNGVNLTITPRWIDSTNSLYSILNANKFIVNNGEKDNIVLSDYLPNATNKYKIIYVNENTSEILPINSKIALSNKVNNIEISAFVLDKHEIFNYVKVKVINETQL